MDEEDAFQKAIDADCNDRLNYLAFADWLAEHGDKREEGYRALALMGVEPLNGKNEMFGRMSDDPDAATIYREWAKVWWWCDSNADDFAPYRLPHDWCDELENNGNLGKAWESKRAARDAAADAWQRLPVETRNVILRDYAK